MLKNITELALEQRLESLWDKMDCCKCEKCREDIMAYALNHLPPQYISTEAGELYAKTKTMSSLYNFDIMRVLALAINIVNDNPRHS